MNTGFSERFYAFLIIMLVSTSCTRIPTDNSLPLADYLKLGVPDPKDPWSMEELIQAYHVLGKLKWEQPLQLPIKGSKKSGDLFERMLSFENLSFLQDTVSLNQKAERITEFIQVYDYWRSVYTHPGIKNNYYHHELAEIEIFNLRFMEAMFHLAKKINKSDNAIDAALKYGYESIKKNYVYCLLGMLDTQSNTSQFLKADLELMADSIYVSVLRNKVSLDQKVIGDLKKSILMVIDSTESKHVQSKYRALHKFL